MTQVTNPNSLSLESVDFFYRPASIEIVAKNLRRGRRSARDHSLREFLTLCVRINSVYGGLGPSNNSRTRKKKVDLRGVSAFEESLEGFAVFWKAVRLQTRLTKLQEEFLDVGLIDSSLESLEKA